MTKFLNWVRKFKEWILITVSILFSFLYIFFKNKALKPPDNSEIKSNIDKNSGKLEIIDDNIEELKVDEINIRKEIEVELKREDDLSKPNSDNELDDFFKDRGF